MPLRIVQISDTHLSHRRAYAVPNVEAILDWIEADPPDLVVHTGDITADDPDDAEEAEFARQVLLSPRPPARQRCPGTTTSAASAAIWSTARVSTRSGPAGERTAGRSSSPPWRLVGANVYRLADADHAAGCGRPSPPTTRSHSSCTSRSAWCGPISPTTATGRCRCQLATRCWMQCGTGRCGSWRPATSTGTGPGRCRVASIPVWAPAASFIGTGTRPDGSTYRVGAVEHRLAADGTATHRLVEPAGVTPLRFEDFAPAGAESLREAPPFPLVAVGSVRPVRPGT